MLTYTINYYTIYVSWEKTTGMPEDVIKESFNQLIFFTIIQFPDGKVCERSVFQSVFVCGFSFQPPRTLATYYYYNGRIIISSLTLEYVV